MEFISNTTSIIKRAIKDSELNGYGWIYKPKEKRLHWSYGVDFFLITRQYDYVTFLTFEDPKSGVAATRSYGLDKYADYAHAETALYELTKHIIAKANYLY